MGNPGLLETTDERTAIIGCWLYAAWTKSAFAAPTKRMFLGIKVNDPAEKMFLGVSLIETAKLHIDQYLFQATAF
jgi:hypothetical protein